MGEVFDGNGEVVWLSVAERALFERFISRLDDGKYDECREIVQLLSDLSIV